jgi:hypothetical protein
MPIVNVPTTFTPVQVDLVSSKKKGVDVSKMKRSCEGALHLKPGPVVLTKDEMQYLKVMNPEVHDRLEFLALTNDEREEVQKNAPLPPAPAPMPADEEEQAPARETTVIRNKKRDGS